MNVTISLVRELIARQFPHLSTRSVVKVEPGGWDNATFRLGSDMSCRLPRGAEYAGQVEKEHRWLPLLAPGLPQPIPLPIALGAPGIGYPYHWSVNRWLEGEPVSHVPVPDHELLAFDLAKFLNALYRIDTAGGPAPGTHNFHRGGRLSVYDAETRDAIRSLGDDIDTRAALSVWEEALEAKRRGPAVWLHGDVSPGNLLVDRNGRLSGVIDFGCCGVGDPACDFVIAWTFFRGQSRRAFSEGLAFDEPTWKRARGWALWKALIVASGLTETNAMDATDARTLIDEILSDPIGVS